MSTAWAPEPCVSELKVEINPGMVPGDKAWEVVRLRRAVEGSSWGGVLMSIRRDTCRGVPCVSAGHMTVPLWPHQMPESVGSWT